MKVKYIISGYSDYFNFEDNINEFIKDKKVIDIKFQEDHDVRRALILYED